MGFFKDRKTSITKTATTLMGTDRLKSHIKDVSGMIGGIKKIGDINKASELEVDLNSVTFDEMLYTWGITRDQIPVVIRGMMLEIYFFFGLIVVSLFFLALTGFSQWQYLISFLAILPTMGGAAIMRYWRVTCLEDEVFIPFKKWIRK